LKKNSPTAAGPTDNAAPDHARVDAINQIFALFERNYHNQFYKAFSNQTDLVTTKRLWLDALARFDIATTLHAARRIIERNEFLPTLATMIKACETQSDRGLPETHAAYLEACRAPSPKASYDWSHLAVYYAGRASDWYFLQNNSEQVAYPVFRQHYQNICERVRLGEQLEPPQRPQLSQHSVSPVPKDEAKKQFMKLRQTLDI